MSPVPLPGQVVISLAALPLVLAVLAVLYLALHDFNRRRDLMFGIVKTAGRPSALAAYPRSPSRISAPRTGSGIRIAGGLLTGFFAGAVLLVGSFADEFSGIAFSRTTTVPPAGQIALTRGIATALPKNASPSVVTPTAISKTSASLQTDAGSPIDGRSLIERWTGRGAVVSAGTEPMGCPNTQATPREYRFTRGGGQQQRATLIVYQSPTALSTDWAVERGSPLNYRGGACGIIGSSGVTYWNQNAVLIIPESSDAEVRQMLVDVFLTFPN